MPIGTRRPAAGPCVLDLIAVDPGCPAVNDVRTVNFQVGGGQQQSIDAVAANRIFGRIILFRG
jgi:hypothetical protein